MNELNEIILFQCRDEVAKRDYNTPFNYVIENSTYSSIIRVMDEASLLALDRQAAFFRWASENGWWWYLDKWRRIDEPSGENLWTTYATELELYQLFKTYKGH